MNSEDRRGSSFVLSTLERGVPLRFLGFLSTAEIKREEWDAETERKQRRRTLERLLLAATTSSIHPHRSWLHEAHQSSVFFIGERQEWQHNSHSWSIHLLAKHCLHHSFNLQCKGESCNNYPNECNTSESNLKNRFQNDTTTVVPLSVDRWSID